MRFDREDYSKSRTFAAFEYMGESFRVVRRRLDGRHWRGYLMVLHGNAPVANEGYAWNDTSDPAECAKLCRAYMETRLTSRQSLAEGLAFIHGSPSHGGRRHNTNEGV